MTSYLISLGQLHENNYSMKLVNIELKVYDANVRLVLKAPMSSNRTFKIGINILPSMISLNNKSNNDLIVSQEVWSPKSQEHEYTQ